MALHRLIEASLGVLLLSQILVSSISSGSEVCHDIVPVDTIARLGQKAELQCRQSSQNIAWIFCSRSTGASYQIASNCDLTPSAVGKYTLDTTDNGCNLILDNVTASDLGTYTCQDLTRNDRGHSADLGNTDENLALHKATYQSTTRVESAIANGSSNKAVDGNTNSHWHQGGSCSSTEAVKGSWWTVDLGQETSVGRVRVTGRSDCCPDLLQRFFIGLTNVSPWTSAPQLNQSSVCKFFTGYPPAGISLDIFCEPNTKPGRYLFFYVDYTQYIQLCEVEAYYR